MTNHKKILWFVSIYAGFAFLLGIVFCLGGRFEEPSLAFAPLGIYIWGDCLILGLLLALGSLALLKINRPAKTGIFFCAYIFMRALIETFYWLNVQFTSVNRPWEKAWLAVLPSQPAFMDLAVIMQIFYTSICIISLVYFFHFLKQDFKQA